MDLTDDTERLVWCRVFLGACESGRVPAPTAAVVADGAIEVLRARGLVKHAAALIAASHAVTL